MKYVEWSGDREERREKLAALVLIHLVLNFGLSSLFLGPAIVDFCHLVWGSGAAAGSLGMLVYLRSYRRVRLIEVTLLELLVVETALTLSATGAVSWVLHRYVV